MSTSNLPLLKRYPALQAVISGCDSPPILREAGEIVNEAISGNLDTELRSFRFNVGDSRINGSALYLEAPLPAAFPGCKPGLAFVVLQAELPGGFAKTNATLPLPRHAMWDSKVREIEASTAWRAQCSEMVEAPRYAQGLFGCAVKKSGEVELLTAVMRYLDEDGHEGAREAFYVSEAAQFTDGAIHNALLLLNGGALPDNAGGFEEADEDDGDDTHSYYEWLIRHKADDSPIGTLARYAAADSLWPRNENDKNALRTHLRKSGKKDLVVALATSHNAYMAQLPDSENDPELPPEAPEQLRHLTKQPVTHDLGMTRVMGIALNLWFDLGEPDAAHLTRMAKSGDPRAMTIAGIRHFIGNGDAPDVREGRSLLEQALTQHGFGDAGLALALAVEAPLYRPDLMRKRCKLLLQAARAGSHGAAEIVIGLQALPSLLTGLNFKGPLFEELMHLFMADGTPQGDIFWGKGQVLQMAQQNDAAIEIYRHAVRAGSAKGCADLADLLDDKGEHEEAREFRRVGIKRNDPKSSMDHGWAMVQAGKNLTEAARLIERGAHAGHFEGIARLGYLYKYGKGVELDRAYGAMLLAIAKGASPLAESELADWRGTQNISVTREQIVKWLTDRARETRSAEILFKAAGARHDLGLDP